MPKQTIQVNVHLSHKIFRDFSLFNSFTRPHRWGRIGLFTAIMAAFAVVCFFKQGGALLGGVLLAVGIGVPAIYIGTFLSGVNKEARKFELEDGRPVYTVELTEAAEGIRVQSSATAKASYAWADCAGAWHRNGCTYLYAAEARAFLLPDDQIVGGDKAALWALLGKMLPAEKLHDEK